jgi:hypothetical protein
MLLGTPRSNSTMLQRTLARHPSVVAPELGQLLFPDRRFLRRLFELFPQALFDTLYDPRIHRTGPLMAEADDLAILSEFREGVFAWAYLQAKEGVERPIVRPEHLLFLNRVHETLSNRGDILVAKYFGGIFHPFEELSTYMSDYEFYLLCRPPREVLYSLSTLLDQAHRKRRFKADKAYWERVYRLMVYGYQRMVELSYEPKVRVLSDHEIKTELNGVLESILPGASTLMEERRPYKRSYDYVDVMDGIFKEDDFQEYFNRFG